MGIKRFLLVIILFLGGVWVAIAQPTIVSINNPVTFPPANFSPQQLVNQVFIRGCAFTSNFTTNVWEGTGPTDKSYGFFRGFGTFPFGEGIVLTTGIASQMGNNFSGAGNISNGNFPPNSTDPDLQLITGAPANLISNATFIQFDFVPITDTISFEYILASEEYSGFFSCNFTDVFAFLIKGPGITPDPMFVGQPNEWKNIAIVPGTNDFVAPTTIRPDMNTANCAAINPTFVGGYHSTVNVAPGATVVPPIIVDTNFFGRTVPMVAQSPVIPGQTYTIKLAVADFGGNGFPDTAFDSGVFLKANSFDSSIDITGPDLGEFVELCVDEAATFELDGTVQIPGTTYQWFFNGAPIAGATGPTLTPTQSGTYRLDVVIPLAGTTCTASDTAFVTIFDPVPQVVNNLVACDVTGTGIATFDLTTIIPDFFGPNQPPGDFLVTFHNTQADADNAVNPITNPTAYDNVTNPETIFVRIEADDANLGATCFETASFTLEVSSVTAGAVTDIEVCDDDNDGSFSFDLTTKDAEAAGTMAPGSVTITYHPTQADADANTNALPNPYTNAVNPETVFVRVELVSDATCFDTTSFQLIVNDTPVPGAVSDFELCDMGNDGVEDFDLTQKDAEVLNGQTGITVTYHNTQADADTGANAIVGLYQNTANPETIYVRLEDPLTGCFDTTSFDLILHAMPIANAVPDQEVCDDAGNDGSEAFDLGALIPTVLGTQDPTAFNVTFHNSQADADTGNNALANIYNNTANPETIFVRIENVNSAICFETTSFELRVFAQPVIVAINDQIVCDDPSNDGTEAFDLDALIPALLGGQNPADFNLSFHTSQADADANLNALTSPYNNTTSPETIFVRLENVLNTTCVDTGFSFNLVVDEQPIANAVPDQEVCDDASNDGTEAFDLNALIPVVLGTQNPANFSVTFHTSQSDADANVNALTSPYNNTASPETIFIRIENNANTDCFDTTSFELRVFELPVIVAINDQIVCDDPSNDGTEAFDLDALIPALLGGQNPADFNLSFHTSQADADANLNALTSPYNNTTSPETIFVRLENVLNTTCVDTGFSFNLVVDDQPIANAVPDQEACDDINNNGTEAFDLNALIPVVLGTQNPANFSVTFHTSQADADANVNALTSPYNNTASPETIFVRIENNTNTDCFDTTSFDLMVNPAPVSAAALPNLELCDINNPGDEIEVFDLTDVEPVLIGGQNFADIDITYHETLADAQAGLNPIANPTAYANTSNNQTIFVRLSNRVTGCGNSTLSFSLIVNPLPQVTAGTVFEQCDDDTADGSTSFDLSSQNTLVTPMPQANVNITYHLTQADANNAANPLPQNFTNTTSPQTIIARIVNVQTGCVNTTDLTLVVIDAPNVTAPADIVVCDDNNPGDLTEVFDLTQTIVEIIGTQTGLTVTFHNSQADADNDVNAIANPASFQNSATTQQIFVRIEHPTGCFNTTSFFIIVNPIPMPFLPETHLLCLDNNGNIVDTASSPPVLDSGLAAAGLVFEWDLNGSILVGENNPTLTALETGIYTVTVTNVNTGCQNTATTEVIPLGPPDDFGAEVVTSFFAERHRIEAFATGLAEQYIFRLDDGPWQYNGTFDNVSPGPHTVSIRDKEGCAEVVISLDVIGYPRYFTPNADGFHDTWNIVGLNGESTTKIYIFDRFGKLLKQINPAGEGWDGTFNGNPLPSSDYWFKVEYVEDGILKTFGGHFTLKR